MSASGSVETEIATNAADGRSELAARHLAFASASLMALAVAAYATSLANGFALDDVHIIQNNSLVHSLDFRRIWSSPYWPSASLGLYRPVTTSLFAIQWALGNGSPSLFHAVSIALHAGVCLLVFLLLRTLLSGASVELTGPLFGAAIFTLHPVHVEAVANVVGQAELLAAAAVLGACVLHARRPIAGIAMRHTVALAGLYALGLGAKEHAIVLPGLLLAIDIAQRRVRWNPGQVGAYARSVAGPALGLLVVAVGFLLARAAVLGALFGTQPNPAYGFLQEDGRLWNAFRAWPEFYRLLFFPLELSVDYSPAIIPVANGLDPVTMIGALLLVGTAVGALRLGASPMALAAVWLLIAILPVSNLLFPIGVLVAERTLYLPSVALAITAGAAGLYLRSIRRSARSVILASGAVMLLVLGVRTAVRNPVWDSTQSVQSSLVRDHPESYRAQWILAAAAQGSGDRARAAHHYETADRIYGADPLFQLEYANFHLQAGNSMAGLRHLQRARALDPRQVPARLTSAYIFNRTGHPDSALALLLALQQEGRVRGDVDLEMARALEGVGEFARAAAAWRAVASQADDSRSWAYYARAARAAARGAHTTLARVALDDAVRAASDDPRATDILESLKSLVESGCFARGSCPDDPLEQRRPESARPG